MGGNGLGGASAVCEEDLARYTQYIVGQKVGTEEIMPIGSLVLDWSD